MARLMRRGGDDLPCRYAIVLAGQSIGGDNWAKNENRVDGTTYTEEGHFIAPAELGAGYTITTPLEPLAALQDDFSVVSNLRIPWNPTSSDASAVAERRGVS